MHAISDILSLTTNAEAIVRIQRNRHKIAELLDRGVHILAPETLEIAADLDPSRIDPSTVLHAGAKLAGARTLIGPGCELGREAPVALENCVLGSQVQLDGGFFSGVTFLDGANCRSGAHLREGTLLEEYASVAHCVGLKQTILFPYVTLGSLINFCDCLMAGGTSRKDHSEVGSGYIHFNFTPRGDKATASLFGDVPHGVLLDQSRIFLGGLAASVGPLQVGYGSFLGPGNVYRRDVKAGRFQLSERQINMDLEFDPLILTGLGGKLRKSATYVGNLVALWHWYEAVRQPYFTSQRALFQSAQETVAAGISERLLQLDKLVALVPESLSRLEAAGAGERATEDHRKLLDRWPMMRTSLEQYPAIKAGVNVWTQVQQQLERCVGSRPYMAVIQELDAATKVAVIQWLSAIVAHVESDIKTRWSP